MSEHASNYPRIDVKVIRPEVHYYGKRDRLFSPEVYGEVTVLQSENAVAVKFNTGKHQRMTDLGLECLQACEKYDVKALYFWGVRKSPYIFDAADELGVSVGLGRTEEELKQRALKIATKRNVATKKTPPLKSTRFSFADNIADRARSAFMKDFMDKRKLGFLPAIKQLMDEAMQQSNFKYKDK